MAASTLIAVGYLVAMILVLRVLKRNYSLLYYKLKSILIFASFAEFSGLVLKVLYILITIVFDVPSEQNSKYAELPLRIFLSLIPLTISSVISIAVI